MIHGVKLTKFINNISKTNNMYARNDNTKWKQRHFKVEDTT